MSHYFLNSFEKYEEAYKASVDNPAKFWEEIAGEFTWEKPWDKTLEWEFNTPDVKWFQGGVLNITENCLDRHLEERGDDIALIWEPMTRRTRGADDLHRIARRSVPLCECS